MYKFLSKEGKEYIIGIFLALNILNGLIRYWRSPKYRLTKYFSGKNNPSVNRQTDNTMSKIKKGQTLINKTLHRKLKKKQHKPY